MSELGAIPRRRRRVLGVLGVVVAVGGTRILLSPVPGIGSSYAGPPEPISRKVEVTVRSTPLNARNECNETFARHDLDHVTATDNQPAGLFDSNGSGVSAADLDHDGFADIVLGNLDRPNTILWNDGDWTFTTERMGDSNTRAVQTVDVDGDGLLDIVTGHRAAGVVVWRNLGERRFARMTLPGVLAKTYSMSWADIDADNDLDLAVSSYDTELDQRLKSAFLFSDGAGVFVYTRSDTGTYTAERVADKSQGLTTTLIDVSLDGTPELVIGNDFAMQDMAFRRTNGGWEPFNPFRFTAAHTMSFDAGDVNNDGFEEYFGTDMKPYSTSTETMAQWMPLMAALPKIERPGDPQRVANVLQARTAEGDFAEIAERSEIDAAGWAWSGRFGDFDNDGHQDLYVVNGMVAKSTFHYLEGAELVERNKAFINRGDGVFSRRDEWGLDAEDSGRGSVHVDLDNDGRLDIVVNNFGTAAVAFQNRLCTDHSAVEIDLRWPGSLNTRALGARVTVRSSAGTHVRYVRSGGGYLSGDPGRVHVGVPAGAEIESIDIRWPDGAGSSLPNPDSQSLLEVTRP